MALSVGRITGLIELRDEFTRKLLSAAQESERAAQRVEQLSRRFGQVGQEATRAGLTLTAGITAPLLGIGVTSVKFANDFASSMNRVKAAIPDGDMERLRAAAQKMGADTVFSSTEAADALVELGKAGFDSTKSIAALPSVLQLAIAGQMEMSDAATLAANTMATFKLRAEDMSHANDVLAKAAASSTIDVRDLAEGMKYVGPIAAQTGISLETVSASMALMGEAGIKGSMAGTALRGMMTALMSPTDKQAAIMEKLGIATAFANGKMMPLADIIGILETKGNITADVMELFGDRAGPGLAALIDKGSSRLQVMEKTLDDTGFAARTANTLMEGLPGALERLRGSAETAMTAFGTLLVPAIEAGANILGKFADIVTNYIVPAIDKTPGPIKLFIAGVVGLTAAIGPLLLAVGAMSYGIESLLPLYARAMSLIFTLGNTVPVLTARLWLMNAAQTALGVSGWAAVAPLVAIGAAIAAIVAALPNAIDGIKNMGHALSSGDFTKIKERDTDNWLRRMIGLGDAKAPGAGAAKRADIMLAPDIPGVGTGGVAGAGAAGAKFTSFSDALKKANAEIAALKPDRVRDLSAAINSGAVSMEDLKTKSGLSESALNLFTERVKKSADATRKATEDIKQQNDQLRQMAASLSGSSAIADAGKMLDAVAVAARNGVPVWKMTADAQDRINQSMTTALDVYKAQGKIAPDAMRNLWFETFRTTTVVEGLGNEVKDLGQQFKIAGPAATDLVDEFKVISGIPIGTIIGTQVDLIPPKLHTVYVHLDALTQSLSQMAQISGGAFGDVVKGLSSIVAAAKTAQDATKNLNDGLKAFSGGEAMQGIMGVASGVMGLGAAAVTTGKALQPLLGIHHGKLGALLGTNRDGRQMVEDFAKTVGGFETLNKRLLSMGAPGRALWEDLTQKVGLSNANEAKDAIERVTKALDDQQAVMDATKSKITDMVQAHLGASATIPQALQATIDKLVEMGQLTEDNARQIMGLPDVAVPSFAAVQSATEVLGVSIDTIGPKISNMAFIERVTPMIGAFETLEAAGADMGAVFAQSTAKIQPLVTEALKFGREMPDAMRPWLERMVDAGLLVDENGDKLTDLSRVKFAEPLTAAVDRLIAKLDEFIANITTKTVPALEGLGRTRIPPIKVPYYYEETGSAVPKNTPVDPGSGMVARNQSAVINVNMDGRTTATAVVPHLADVVDVNVG